MGMEIPLSLRSARKPENRSSCCLVNSFSRSSALAKWVKAPSIWIPGRAAIRSTVSAACSPGSSPMRPIPVSTAIWILAVLSSRQAVFESSFASSYRKMVGRISSLTSSSYRSLAAGPSTRMPFPIPCFLSCRASSAVATPYPDTNRSMV